MKQGKQKPALDRPATYQIKVPDVNTHITLLGVGLAALAVAALQKEE